MSERKMGVREAQMRALREAKYERGQAKNRENKTRPETPKKPKKTVKKKRGK